jgi:tRNA(adenine34) deaminase
MQAITAAAEYLGGKYLSGCTLYVTVEPCVMCAGAAQSSRIGRLVYGAANFEAGATASLYNVMSDPRLGHNPPVEHGLLAEESAALLKEFFQQRR